MLASITAYIVTTLTAPLAMLAEGGGEIETMLDPKTGAAIWTWIAFLLALPVMWKFVYGPITRALEDRDTKVTNAIAAADEARQKAEAQVAEAKTELDTARADAKRTVQEAVASAERQAQMQLDQAKAEADRQLQKARTEIEAEKRAALQEIRKEVVDMTIASTEKLLKKSVDDQSHRASVEEFLAGAR